MADSTTYVTTRTGQTAKISGSDTAVNRVIVALRQAGARWNRTVQTFDFGFYDDTPKAKPKLATVIHPLPIGTRIKSIAGEVDDPGDGSERKSGRGAIGRTGVRAMSRIYQVTFTCDVTAASPEEAVKLAADDMTDTDLEMVWKVTDSETGQTLDVTNPQAFTE